MTDENLQTPPEGTQNPEPVIETPTAPETPVVETPAPEVPPAPVNPEAQVDYKKKFTESSREAQLLQGRLKEMERTIGELTAEDIPTDEEMKTVDPNWDFYSEMEQRMFKKNVALERKLNKTTGALTGFISDQKRRTELDEIISSKPELKGKEKEFEAFAARPNNKGVPMETLVSAFLYEVKDELPPEPDDPNKIQGQPVLNSGGAGKGIQSKTEQYTLEEAQNIRKTDPTKYNELIRKGIIK